MKQQRYKLLFKEEVPIQNSINLFEILSLNYKEWVIKDFDHFIEPENKVNAERWLMEAIEYEAANYSVNGIRLLNELKSKGYMGFIKTNNKTNQNIISFIIGQAIRQNMSDIVDINNFIVDLNVTENPPEQYKNINFDNLSLKEAIRIIK